MHHGYARCSTNESKQDIDRQVRELKQAGAESIFLEYEHGDAAVKCQLSSLLEQAQPGDTIITLEVSRLARSTKQLCEIIEIIRSKHLRLVIVGSITVDCSNGEIDPMTNAFIQMSGVFAELELRITRSRVRSGMANAKAKGVKIGRPQATADDIPAVFLRHYPAYKNKQLNVSELARVCDLSRTTVYKYTSIDQLLDFLIHRRIQSDPAVRAFEYLFSFASLSKQAPKAHFLRFDGKFAAAAGRTTI